MATKVYWKGLRLKLDAVNRYIGDHFVQLDDNLTDEQMDAVSEARAAVEACLIALPENTPIT